LEKFLNEQGLARLLDGLWARIKQALDDRQCYDITYERALEILNYNPQED